MTATTSIVTMHMVLSFSKGWIGIQLPRRSFWLYVSLRGGLLIAYTCTFFALQRGMVSMVSPLINVNPLYSMILSYIFLQSEEKVTLKVVSGGSLIVGGHRHFAFLRQRFNPCENEREDRLRGVFPFVSRLEEPPRSSRPINRRERIGTRAGRGAERRPDPSDSPVPFFRPLIPRLRRSSWPPPWGPWAAVW